MAQSPEYPDLPWMPPRSWTDANRTSVQLIVIHTTEGSEGPASAEDGAAYDQRRTDGTSTHFFHDSDSTVQCVRTADIAHAARTQGNRRGIQHELCGRAGQGAAGWADAASQGTLRHAARQCARDAKRWGIPVRHLTVAQVAAGAKGFCGHVDVTRAFPQDNGTHTDPGPTFPWSDFLDMVRAELEDDMAFTDAQMRAFPWQYVGGGIPAGMSTLGVLNELVLSARAQKLRDEAILAAVKDKADTTAILARVDAKAAELAAQVDQVDEAVWSRIPDPTIPLEEKANLLRAVLGVDAAAVGALLQRV